MKVATAFLVGILLSLHAAALAQPVKAEDILATPSDDWNDEGDGSTNCDLDFYRMSVDLENSVMTNTKTDAVRPRHCWRA